MMVKATLTGSYGYRDPISGVRKYYGPGIGIEVPEGLAKTLGVSYEALPSAQAPEMEPAGEDEQATAGLLPAGFPGLPMLIKAGYSTVGSVRNLTIAEIGAIEGISRSQARNIARAIKELET